MQFCLRGSNNVLHVFSLKFASFMRYYICEETHSLTHLNKTKCKMWSVSEKVHFWEKNLTPFFPPKPSITLHPDHQYLQTLYQAELNNIIITVTVIKIHRQTHLTFLSFVTSVCKYSSALAVWRAILTLISQGNLCCPFKSLRSALCKSLCIFGYIRQQGFLKGDIKFSKLRLYYHLNLSSSSFMFFYLLYNYSVFSVI